MHKVAVMGDYDSIYGYGALGLDIFPGTDKTAAVRQLKRLVNGGYAIVYITESLAEEIMEEIDKYKEDVVPAIILIPGVAGNTKDGIRRVKACVEKAIGSDIVFGDE